MRGGILMTFVPWRRLFKREPGAWQRFSSPALTVITLSSSGALSSSCRETTYCDAAGNRVAGDAAQTLIAGHETHIIDLHVKDTRTATDRIIAIQNELERLQVRMPLSSDSYLYGVL
jgi:hypothetical protein